MNPSSTPLLEAKGIKVHFPVRTGLFQKTKNVVKAVDGVDLAVAPGETLAVVGESGSGKSTLGRALFNETLPEGFEYIEERVGKKEIGRIVDRLVAPIGFEQVLCLQQWRHRAPRQPASPRGNTNTSNNMTPPKTARQ